MPNNKSRVIFTGKSAKRISKVVRRVEKTPHNRYFNRRGRSSGPAYVGFWAKIKGAGSAGNRYDWVAVERAADGTVTERPDWGSGDGDDAALYAMEAQWRSSGVIINDLVFLKPAMHSNIYLFEYTRSHVNCKGTATASSGGAPGTGTANVYVNHSSTGQTIDVVNWSGGAVTSADMLVAAWVDGEWQIIFEPCTEGA